MSRSRVTLRRIVGAGLVAWTGLLAASGCQPEEEPIETIPVETFIATYVDLRMATLRAGVDQIPTAERDRILAEHGVGEDDLLEFVDVRGRDALYMHTVWDSIEAQIDELRSTPTVPDSAGMGAP